MSSGWYPVLFLASFAAGFVDSIAGGGGLITVPVLLSAGLPPQVALGTNKLQATFGSGSATLHFARAGLIGWAELRLGVIVTFFASMLGAFAVQQVRPDFLRRLIPVLLIGIAVYSLVQPGFGTRERPPRLRPHVFAIALGGLIGFYDGFFGPGTGTFWAMACVVVMGFNLTKATAYTKAVNFASNVGSLLVFLVGGQVEIFPGLLMGVGQWTGARLGSRLVIRQGAKLIRPIFITVVLAITVKLLLGR
ncbi:MAG: TSUP family transporter [Verrucomicrobia bacterium]|nr:TSUP family transporter [Verrucomicrobiota bacterium]